MLEHMDSTIGSRSLRWTLATPTGERGLELEVRYCVGVVKTTMIYTHVLNRGGHGVQSPLDLLDV